MEILELEKGRAQYRIGCFFCHAQLVISVKQLAVRRRILQIRSYRRRSSHPFPTFPIFLPCTFSISISLLNNFPFLSPSCPSLQHFALFLSYVKFGPLTFLYYPYHPSPKILNYIFIIIIIIVVVWVERESVPSMCSHCYLLLSPFHFYFFYFIYIYISLFTTHIN